MPHRPHAKPAITGACQLFRFSFGGMDPRKRINFIKNIATIAAKGPIIAKLIKMLLILNEIAVSKRGGLTIPISVAEKLAAIDEIARAATAFIEKCLKTVS